jgi:Flp pilus assembly protein TadG
MRRGNSGQTMVIIALVLPVLLGSIALAVDVAVFYFNWTQLQKATDAAALGGANYLPDNPSQAKTVASQVVQSNGVNAAEIASNTVSPDDLSLTIKAQRQVPYYFGRVLGLTSGTVAATSTAQAQFPPSTVNANSPAAVPAGGDNGGANGGVCGGIGVCGLVPIGLDSNTAYSDGSQITLQQGQLGPGNWDLLALGGVGGNNLRTNIADGYNSMVSVGDWITTEPGQKVGPVDQGFQDRLNLAATADSGGTFSSHTVSDPRVLIVPVVNWQGQNGRSQVQVTAFATLWLDSYNKGQVTVHMISQVIANSFGNPNAPSFGARGTPRLIK